MNAADHPKARRDGSRRHLVAVGVLGFAFAAAGELELTTMVAHWANYADDDYLAFIDEAQPDLAQIGFYGAHYWSLAHTPQFGGYPAHFPVRGLAPCADWMRERNRQLHQRGVKAIGHFNIEFLVGTPATEADGPRGFFAFYDQLWDDAVLGPRPEVPARELLERAADGTPIINHSYAIGGMDEYWACLRNPHWQQVLKAWVRHGIDCGIDGFMINYFYRHNCLCEHCRLAFKSYLHDRFTAAELLDKFGIADVAAHHFDELLSWHDPAVTTPLRLEMLRFSQLSNKQVFDSVFLDYGRSLKPDLIVGQWNHLGNFSQINGDERCLLPASCWGRGEDYLWYSAGGSANSTDLTRGDLGEVTLQARYLRGAFGGRPFTIGKYESTRIRSAIAELAANGGAPMGFYSNFHDPAARQEIVRYYQFIRRYRDRYLASRSHAEVLLLFPRSLVHRGETSTVARFRELGKQLLDQHLLFDVVPDDLATAQTQARYHAVVRVEEPSLQLPADLSRITAPATVRVSASRAATGELLIHLVNYDRREPPKTKDGKPSPGSGIAEEQPLAASAVAVDLALPPGIRSAAVTVVTPERPDPVSLQAELAGGRLRFTVPEFLVYAVAAIQLTP